MFKGKTVFILGAGASIPYGFPSGYELVSNICANLRGESKIKIINEALDPLFKAMINKILDFRESLSKAVVESIDDFLEARPDYLEIGKAVIAQALIPYEKEDSLFARNRENNWYSLIFEVLRNDIDKLENEQISFITFNYDRSLEHYLYTQLREFLNIPVDECKNIMSKIPIIHVYGHIGNLEWQHAKDVRKYEPHANIQNISTAMGKLSVVHESIEQKIITKAQDLIKVCDKIRLLGYGFHDTNTERLNLVDNARGKEIRATSVGLSNLDRKRIKKQFNTEGILDNEERNIVRFFKELISLEE